MLGESYDHLVGVIVIGTIFISAVIIIPSMSYTNMLYVDQQQLRNTALDTLKTILLDTGYPANWGSTYDFDPDQVERFGLTLAGSSSFYVLDPDKVERLVVGNPAGFIKYEALRTKLELQGYGFNFKIIPPFKVFVNDGESDIIVLEDLVKGVEVFATFNNGRPITKASVEAILVYIIGGSDIHTVKVSNRTDVLGKCVIKPVIPHDPSGISSFILVIKASVADATTVISSYKGGFSTQYVMNASIIGGNITLAIPEGPGWEKGSSGTRWIDNVVVANADGVWNIYNGTQSDKITWGGENWGWSRIFSGLSYYEPTFIIFNISVPNPRRSILFLGPERSRVEDYGNPTGAKGVSTVVEIQRNVIISSMTHIAELSLWKEFP